MTDNHPITPPPELVQHWARTFYETTTAPGDWAIATATEAARWGADQELEACCKCINDLAHGADAILVDLRTARRPKQPSLKEQALKAVQNIDDACESEGFSRADDTDIIRRALESLPS